ncbi:hypothetical protein DPMN_184591 [Dreissena polymorpha]|uniref:G-protein coupled receptors family 1 profile domain-containing protein n=1 Tax=Dreissena polymorpha TaxID=45954 RepID=A0A9D4DKC6_DREPO|nr:hypothetical protein DPMN_184591 [Dreissena polymorpha]
MNLTADELNANIKKEIAWVTAFIGAEAFLGFFGNIIVIFVFTCRYHYCNFRYFALCLAVLDLSAVLTTLTGEMVTLLYWYIFPPIAWLCKMKSFFNIFTVTGEAFCLCAIAVDRYRKLCKPHGWQIHKARALRLCVAVIATAFVLSFPGGILRGVQTETYLNVSITACENDEKYISTGLNVIYIYTIFAIDMCVVLATIMLYIPVTRILWRRHSESMNKLCILQTDLTKAESTNDKAEIYGNFDCFTYDDTRSNAAIQFNSEISTSTALEQSETVSSAVYLEASKVHQLSEQGLNKISGGILFDSYGCAELTQGLTTIKAKEVTASTPIDINNVNVCDSTQDVDVKKDSEEKRCNRINANEHLCAQKLAKQRILTRIPIVLSSIFAVTVILYFGLVFFMAHTKNKKLYMHDMSDKEKGFLSFGLRLVFINHVINPIVYWVMDNEFKTILQKVIQNICSSCKK